MKEIEEYINQVTWRIQENANTNFSLSGLKSYLASTFLARDAIGHMPRAAGQYHINGAIHVHDLDGGQFSPYCLGADLLKVLQIGIKTPGAISKPAKHFDVLVDHLVNMTYMYTQEWNGAIAWRDFDILAAPFVAYDNLSYDQVKQNMQRLIFNLSYPLRAAYQNPFTNITFALKPPSYYKNMNVIVGGKVQDEKYSYFQDEINMINLAFCDIMIEGDELGRPHTFPLPTYNITEDFDWDSNVADKIFEMTAKYGLPYFSNYLGNETYKVSDSVSMCCRLRLNTKEINKVTGGIWNYGSNTGSLAITTINLSQIGHLSKDDNQFYQRLDRILEACKEYLLWKKERIKWGFEHGLMPVSYEYIHTLDTFFLTIGIIAMNEACINLHQKNIVEDEIFAEQVTKYISDKTFQFQRETGHLFNFEATPGEGASYRLAKIDRKRFPDIFTQGTNETPYYTGSNMIPANHPFQLDFIDHQQKMQKYFTGGSILHMYFGEPATAGAVKNIIKGMCTSTILPYISYSPIYSICSKHGIHYKMDGICPTCGEQGEVYSRVVGYYRPVSKWNVGKQQEFRDRYIPKSYI